jgi:hypothetical protein
MNFIDDIAIQSSERRSIKVLSNFYDRDVHRLTCAQESDRSIIGASTPCCPTCWELLDILKKKATDFAVHSRHTTLSQVQLPPWVPRDIMMEMVDRLRKILLHQITAMMGKQDRIERDGNSLDFYQQSRRRGSRFAFDGLNDGKSDNDD